MTRFPNLPLRSSKLAVRVAAATVISDVCGRHALVSHASRSPEPGAKRRRPCLLSRVFVCERLLPRRRAAASSHVPRLGDAAVQTRISGRPWAFASPGKYAAACRARGKITIGGKHGSSVRSLLSGAVDQSLIPGLRQVSLCCRLTASAVQLS